MEEITFKILRYLIATANSPHICTFCKGNIQEGESYIRLIVEVSGFNNTKQLLIHNSPDYCKEIRRELRKSDTHFLRVRKNQLAKEFSSNEIITERNITRKLFENGYKLVTTTRDEKIVAEKTIEYQEAGKPTAIALIDEWYEVWVKLKW